MARTRSCLRSAPVEGEVFRARDTRLNRDVAIKILPPLFADDPDRLARFTRGFDISSDGRRFIRVQQAQPDRAVPRIEVVLNWASQLAR